uniref:Matrix-remodeling-associated protein 7 helical domain-containing protein n=1 Tax=Setaria digitata TaxID=48799 RepID=A0A915PVK3_9BILA
MQTAHHADYDLAFNVLPLDDGLHAELMHTFEDYDDTFRNPDTVMHSLPPYGYLNFYQEYPEICIITVALCAIAASIYFWRLFWMRQEEQLGDIAFNSQFNLPISNKLQQRITDRSSEACNNIHSGEKSKVVPSLDDLYGKLATVELRKKAKQLEKAMTEEERREEQLIQQKQLDSIWEMILQKPEKFGLHDKSEITEQMKLYSI